jgi:hypothetical protein
VSSRKDETYTLDSYKSDKVIPYDIAMGGLDIDQNIKDTISGSTTSLLMTERVIHSIISLVVIAQVLSNYSFLDTWTGSQERGLKISIAAKALLDMIPIQMVQELTQLVPKYSSSESVSNSNQNPSQEDSSPLQLVAQVMRGIIGTPPVIGTPSADSDDRDRILSERLHTFYEDLAGEEVLHSYD